MIDAVLLNGITSVTAPKPVVYDRNDTARLLPQLDPGQILSARVGAKLPDGSFMVKVAGQEMRMQLPEGMATGDKLELAFVGRYPRPTFVLQQGLPASGNTPLLSTAGRLVAAMLPQQGEPAMLASTAAAAPLLASLPEDGAGLSATLARTLTQSGLFYEAHQAEWVAGKRDLSQLQGEPQAKFNVPQARPGALQAGAPVWQAAALVSPASTNPTAGADAALILTAASAAGNAVAQTPLADQLQMQSQGPSLVQQQLAALESGRIVMRMEIWPGQWMEWEVEDPPKQSGHESEASQNCNTKLRLDLPRLGELNATLNLGANGVQIRVDAASASSAALLHEHRASLHAALAAAGVPPAGIAVAHHG